MDLNDLSLAYADLAVTVTHRPPVGAEASGQALFDRPGAAVIDGEVLATDYSLRYPAVTFPNVTFGDQFVIGADTYTVRAHPQAAAFDGLEFIVPLART